MIEEYFYDITLADLRTKLISRKENLKLNYAELSAMTNVSRETLRRFINGNNSINASTFRKLVEWIQLQILPFTTLKCGENTTIFLQEVPHVQHINKYTSQPTEWIK